MTLQIRTENPSVFERQKQQMRQGTNFRNIADPLRSRSSETTYCLDRSARHIKDAEAARVLYSPTVQYICSLCTVDVFIVYANR